MEKLESILHQENKDEKYYQAEFEEALLRNGRLGVSTPDFKLTNERYITEGFIFKLPYIIRDTYGELSVEDLVAKCIPVHFGLVAPIAEYLGIPVYFTLGDFSINEKRAYKVTEDSLKEQLVNGANLFSINIHAWLTLPSMEIIDITLPTTVAKIHKSKEVGGIISKHYSELSGGVAYHPMLIGEEYLRKLNYRLNL